VRRTSAPTAASPGEAAAVAPASTNETTLAGERFQTLTLNPAEISLAVIGLPMCPMPSTPTVGNPFCIGSWFLMSLFFIESPFG
jgi:hypothetical protein